MTLPYFESSQITSDGCLVKVTTAASGTRIEIAHANDIVFTTLSSMEVSALSLTLQTAMQIYNLQETYRKQ